MGGLADGYWTLIADAFDKVSVYDGHDVYASQTSIYPEHVRHLLAAHWCQSEICNGGFNQFFANSTGVLAVEAVAGFRAIGLTDVADLVQNGVARFGAKYPSERSPRQRRLKGGLFTKKTDFEDLDQPFYDLLEKHGGFEHAATKYAERFAR